jgi:hypothetical protein
MESIDRKRAEQRKAGEWGKVAVEAAVGFALRFIALLIIAGALFALLAVANVAQPIWLAPFEEQPLLVPTPWSEQNAA